MNRPDFSSPSLRIWSHYRIRVGINSGTSIRMDAYRKRDHFYNNLMRMNTNEWHFVLSNVNEWWKRRTTIRFLGCPYSIILFEIARDEMELWILC